MAEETFIYATPNTNPGILDEIRKLAAAMDGLLNALSLDCHIAAAYIEDAHGALTEMLENVESADSYERTYQDERENDARPVYRGERYP